MVCALSIASFAEQRQIGLRTSLHSAFSLFEFYYEGSLGAAKSLNYFFSQKILCNAAIIAEVCSPFKL